MAMRFANTIREATVIVRSVALPVLFIATLSPAAHAEIFTCTDEFGNVAYLQTPCPEKKAQESPAADGNDTLDVDETEVKPATELPVELRPPEVQVPSSRQPDEQLDACKKRFRDQIDAIDLEIRADFSPSKGEEYKARLKVLTRQLRACGQS
ncbi:MAG: DUF4124 domain-containing protein [Gammaproteobacteria bacterium]|nr:DUF4124 domain-containing protein [Gammaproteobacteria bacterium]